MNLPIKFRDNITKILQDDLEHFLAALDQPAPVSIRTNPAKSYPLKFTPSGNVPWSENGIYLEERPVFTLDPGFHAGAYYVQEASSMVLEHAFKTFIRKDRPLKVLDLCAAPGGKSTLLASMLKPEDLLVANEVIKSRVGILKENLTKWGYPNVIISQHDSEDFEDLKGFFDLVVVDAPCSGEGLFRKNPDAVLEWSEENVNICTLRQKRILAAAAELVATGGHLFYSTCTYNQNENQENANWLVKNYDFEIRDIPVSETWGIVKADPGIQFFPYKIKGEGFYLAVFRSQETGRRVGKKKKTDLLSVPRKNLDPLSQWIIPEVFEQYTYYQKQDGTIVAIPDSLENDFKTVLSSLYRRSSGIELGHFKGKDFIPSNALAMTDWVPSEIQRIELSEAQALEFLSKGNLEPKGYSNGWSLITDQNLNLGWVKIIGNRINNYYPTEWRIRMKIR